MSVGGKLSGIEDNKVWLSEILKLLERWSNKHRMHEESMIGARADNTNGDL